jgi:ArsR family transcriptional regulator
MRCMGTIELPVRQRGQCCDLTVPVEQAWADKTAALLKTLADPTRLAMVMCLARAKSPVCICDFTAAFDLGQPTLSHHMARLKAAGLVDSHKQGIWIYYRLRDDLPPPHAALIETLLTSAGLAE